MRTKPQGTNGRRPGNIDGAEANTASTVLQHIDFGNGGPLQGALQQRRNFAVSELLWLDEPAALTPGEWATLPCAGVTAWNCLSGLKPGQTVLLIGTGGVSLFGLQIAKMHGARVLILSSSAEKRQWAKEMGADAVSDYQDTDWGRWALEQTEGRGVESRIEA